MQGIEYFVVFTRPLDRADISYMVGGSVASMVYGEPRLTNDIDLVIDLPAGAAATMAEAFSAEEFYIPPREVIEIELRRALRGHFNLIHHATGFKADIYLRGSDPLHDWAFPRRRQIHISSDTSLWIAPPEYVIARKLEFFREGASEKHLHDIRGILATSGDLIHYDALEVWIKKLGVESAWQTVTKHP